MTKIELASNCRTHNVCVCEFLITKREFTNENSKNLDFCFEKKIILMMLLTEVQRIEK